MSEYTSSFINTLEIKPYIFREVYEVQKSIGNEEFNLLEGARVHINPQIADGLSSKFNNNSEDAYRGLLGSGRPLSAFYTLFPEGYLVIEQGTIDPKGEGKLHNYLRQNIDYFGRQKKGALVRSGHIGSVIFPNAPQTPVRVALFDNLHVNSSISTCSPDFPYISTLLGNNIIPISSDGFAVKVF